MDRLRARAIESLYLIQEILGAYDKAATGHGHVGWRLVSTSFGSDRQPALDTVGSTWRQKAIPAGTVSGLGRH